MDSGELDDDVFEQLDELDTLGSGFHVPTSATLITWSTYRSSPARPRNASVLSCAPLLRHTAIGEDLRRRYGVGSGGQFDRGDGARPALFPSFSR